jgi:transposase
VIDIMTRLKIHDMSEGGVLQEVIAKTCEVSLRSVERVLEEPTPTLGEVRAGELVGARPRGRPSKADEGVQEKVTALLELEPSIMATEVLRRSVAWGYTGSKSAMSALVKRLRPEPKREPWVRFEGLPGEYAQFDFGEAWVTYIGGKREKVVFFAGRLKYSRYMHVLVVPNQQAETLVRALICCLFAFGGSPKEWVFDNPRTIRLSCWGKGPLVLHPYMRDLVAGYRVIPTFCAPRSGNQKGSVERLVGYTKKSFLFARKFADRADLQAQLVEWLREVNHDRPSDANGVIPDVARQQELRWLRERPTQVQAEDHVLQDTATVTPMGTISWKGTSYFATATRLGAPATLLVRQDTLEIIVGDGGERCTHVRRDGMGVVVQRLPGQRQDMLAVIHGRRKHSTFRRQCLLELGRPAWDFMEVLVHRCPDGRWERPCTDLYELMQVHGDDAMRAAFVACCARRTYTVVDVATALKEAGR